MIAPVNSIIPISTVDGPGARTAVFLQGCNIACAYCHNPETQRLCIHCGACVPGCPSGALKIEGGKVVWDAALCTGCDACLAACPHFASPKVSLMSAAQVMERVRENMPFIRGITVSGGECTLYPEFLLELFTLAKRENLSCLIDSNGSIPLADYPELLELCDGVMLDVKAWKPEVYADLTGGHSNSTVKENLALLSRIDKLTELRIVCLPGYVDAQQVVAGIAGVLPNEQLARVRLKLIRFRPNGVRGHLEKMPVPSDDFMQNIEIFARERDFKNIVVV